MVAKVFLDKRSLIYLFSLLVLSSCGKEQNAVVDLTSSQFSATTTSVTIEVTADVSNGDNISQIGILYGLDTNIRLDNIYNYNYDYEFGNVYSTTLEASTNPYTVEVKDLYTNADYYYVPFCVVDGKFYSGDQIKFETNCPDEFSEGPAGGFVIYDDGNGGGIEAAPFDISYFDPTYNGYRLFKWGCLGNGVAGTADSIGSGQTNTDTIVAQCTELNHAALACKNFEYGGYSDWYLPSINELALIYSELYAKNGGNFAENLYNNHWSSSQQSIEFVKSLDFNTGTIVSTSSKGGNLFVRPVRSF